MVERWRIIILVLALGFFGMIVSKNSTTVHNLEFSVATNLHHSNKMDKPKNPEGYAEFRKKIRIHPDGKNVTQLLIDAKTKVAAMPVMSLDKDAGLWDWQWLGPGNIGGRVRAILTHPTAPNTLWAGSAGGGIWKTVNGGSSWFPLNDLLPSLAITSLTMDPTNSDIIYAGTGEGFTSMGLPGAGVFKSFDGGTTWHQLPGTSTSEALYVNDIAHHPVNSGWLIACVVTQTDDGEIWRTINGGEDWSIVATSTSRPMDVKYDPDDPDVVLIGAGNSAFRSDNSGLDWDLISDGSATGLPSSTGRCEFTFGMGNNVVFASLDVYRGPKAREGEIWRSLDNGITWEKRSELYHLGTQGFYDNVIWLEPGSTQDIIVGGVDLFVSSDGGETLDLMNDWGEYHTGLSAHADQHAIVPHINYGTNGNFQIYIGNDGGVQVANNGLLTTPLSGWTNLANNLGVTQFYHADVTPDGSIILGGSQDNDDLRYTTAGGSQGWYQATTGDGTFCAINPLDTNTMYACYPLLRMQRSLNGGDTYHDIFEDITDAGERETALFVSPFALDKVAPYRLFAGGESIWLSNDHGANWHVTLEPHWDAQLCSAIEISPTAGSMVVWVGYEKGAIWKTEDSSVNWSAVDVWDDPLPGDIITDIEISPHNPDVVMITFGGYLPNRVWLTTDNGSSWQNISGTGDHKLPEIQMNCITFHPSIANWIYVGTDLGLFASEDMGQTWSVTPRHDLNEGPVYTEIADLIWHSGDTLIAVTHGRGMFQCRPMDVVWVDIANNDTEDGTFTNPYNTVTEGYDSCGNGTSLIIQDGDYTGNHLVMEKKIMVESTMGGRVIIR